MRVRAPLTARTLWLLLIAAAVATLMTWLEARDAPRSARAEPTPSASVVEIEIEASDSP